MSDPQLFQLLQKLSVVSLFSFTTPQWDFEKYLWTLLAVGTSLRDTQTTVISLAVYQEPLNWWKTLHGVNNNIIHTKTIMISLTVPPRASVTRLRNQCNTQHTGNNVMRTKMTAFNITLRNQCNTQHTGNNVMRTKIIAFNVTISQSSSEILLRNHQLA